MATIGSLTVGLTLASAPSVSAEPASAAASGAHFVVLVPKGAPLDDAESAVVANDGVVVRKLPQIGVVLARSQRADFAAKVRREGGVAAAGATRNLAELTATTSKPTSMPVPVHGQVTSQRGALGPEPLAANQWDMKLIGADQANEEYQGSPDVLIGLLDSGIDATHPDLAPNLDKSASVSCANDGLPDTAEASWQDNFGHGTHVAGIVAAAKNGIGTAGVAPDVHIAAIKVGDAEGYIYPESAMCGYLWAADHGVDIANSSFSIDPWYFWCGSDPDQAATTEAIRRSVSYAAVRGVTTVASLGNYNWDLAHDVVDPLSPTNGAPVTRTAGAGCAQLPVELNGVVGVSSVGASKSRYYNSNYGTGVVDFAAPGGDRKFQIPATPDANGQILSTLPGGTYGYMQGTSMAAPHVTGVLALLKSRNPMLSGNLLIAAAAAGAEVLPCPASGVHDPDGQGTYRAVCEGGATGAGFYGHGLINALNAVH
ncbi:S8 family serine peptidase [Amycolatopsis sp. A133]|uniref:S8 family peptidase n=1 Tax=Amycolatopsis sp. A133 TaxID=3064472 RepID=UPI0027FF7CB0|nr:S8 family serine peptidase [Amycolatopsis sp. A133]MDQ7809118.1 S8 family serine peptidase [Amycolatopsis sp. A133]